ncbi:MAG: hypothetical protein JXR59_04615 [Desulfuromonadaceae bacterium]|nr:hypothetical protein [Desulfuromonadaceae bacterium]
MTTAACPDPRLNPEPLPAELSIELQTLRSILRQLRGPDGCPWDQQQTTESLRPFLLEETYEVLHALDQPSAVAVCHELGDLLMLIVFYAHLFEEKTQFDFTAIVRAINDKMIRRHPHVFGEKKNLTELQLEQQWQRIKDQEQLPGTSFHHRSDFILPSLKRAKKQCQRQPPAVEPAIRTAFSPLSDSAPEKREAEYGRLLLQAVQIGCQFELDAEDCLRRYLDHP